MAAVITVASCGNAKREETDSANAAKLLMQGVKGCYVELFSDNTLLGEKWDSLWTTECAKYVGEESAQATAALLKSSMNGNLTGEAATEMFGDGSDGWKNGFQFNCHFHNGIEKFIFDGKGQISGTGHDGTTIFSHRYTFSGYDAELDFYIFKSEDGNKDEFAYFALRPDTPAETHHIEFRYGTDAASLIKFCTGKYAYWMAAGVLDGKESEQAESIRLFVEENAGQQQ